MTLETRVTRLEDTLAPRTARMVLLCVHDGESDEAALARHAVQPGTQDTIVYMHAFATVACAACRVS